MAEKKISQLTAKGATVADTDLLVVSEAAGGGSYTTKSITGANIKALVTDANLTTTDITTNNVSTSKHGFAPKAPNDSTKFLDGTGAWSTPASGGLTQFTEAANSSAPNGTVPVNSLTATGAATNIDAAIRPKGTGAILAQIPDNTTAGGNKRGANAVDLCLGDRGNANQVASGSYSAIIGGRYNRASGTASFSTGESNSSIGAYSFSGGQSNTINGTYSIGIGGSNSTANDYNAAIGTSNTCTTEYFTYAFGHNNAISSRGQAVGNSNTCSGLNSNAFGRSNISSGAGATSIGDTNTASGTNAAALGGILGLASGNYSSVVGGYGSTASGVTSIAGGDGCVASATWAVALGGSNSADATSSVALGLQSSAFGIYGRNVFASGQEGTKGDSQTSKFVLRERTTGNTATTLTTNSSAASTNNQVILSNQSAYRFKGSIVGKQSGSTNAAVWDIDGFIVRGANAAATTLNVSNVTLVQNTPAWGTPTLAADTTNGGLQVQVTGAAATNIQWTAVIETTEVIYA